MSLCTNPSDKMTSQALSPIMDAALKSKIASYLQIQPTNIPDDPIQFLHSYFSVLPSSFLKPNFSWLSPKQRSVLPAIRNRRFAYTKMSPKELSFSNAKLTWPSLWHGHSTSHIRPGVPQGQDEHSWAKDRFMDGSISLQVGKLPDLLRDYEEERQAQHIRATRLSTSKDDVPEEEEEEDTDSDEDVDVPTGGDDVESESDFERRIHQLFIYGLLEKVDYDSVDWNDSFDDERESQDTWIMNDSDDDD